MNRIILLCALLLFLCGCFNVRDMAKNLRYANNTPVGVENIKFIDLQAMSRGESCTLNFLYFIPLWGDGSIITAAENGNINTVELIGETGYWTLLFSRNCTVVFGDKNRKAPPPVAPAEK